MKKEFFVIGSVFLFLINFAALTTAADTDSLVVDTSGKVGIGTTTPWSKLSIRVDGLNEGSDVQSASGWIRFMPGTMGTGSYNSLSRAGDNGIIFSAGSLNTGNLVIGPHANSAAGIKILSNGNVGIGTTSPDTVLTIRQSNPVLTLENINYNYDSGGVLRFGHDQGGNKTPIGEIRGELYNGSSNRGGAISFWTSNAGALSERIRINNNGNIGIGTTSPEGRFHVQGSTSKFIISNSANNVILQTTDTSVNHYPFISFHDNAGTRGMYLGWGTPGSHVGLQLENNNNLAIIGGNVGIGTTSPTEKLHVAGNIKCTGLLQESDIRWKENIESLENALNIVTQLRGVSYTWIDPSRGEGRQIGVIAQEVEQVLPEVVHTDSQGYKSVEYSKLVAPLIEAVKTLKAQNERLEQRNSELERRLETIEAMFVD